MGDKKVKCVIVSGSPSGDSEYIKRKIGSGDFVIAADSGYITCLGAGVYPNLVIGDFDSSEKPRGEFELIELPIEKDDTDTFFSVKEAVKRGFKEIEIFCALGGRFDHCYSNLLCLEYCRERGVICRLSDEKNRVCLVEKRICIDSSEYEYFSVFAFLQKASGVSIRGAYYSLNNYELEPWDQIGQSNHFKNGEGAEISVDSGIILLIQSND